MEKEATSARAEVESAGSPPQPPPLHGPVVQPTTDDAVGQGPAERGEWGGGGARKAGGGAEGATMEGSAVRRRGRG